MELASLIEVKKNPNVPQVRPGDTVKVSVKVVEGDRERIQNFQGLVIRIRRGGIASNFTVRRVAYGVGVERTFFMASPRLEKVEVLRHGKVRRANLYYLRKLSGKAAQLKERRGLMKAETTEAEETAETAAAQPEAAAPAPAENIKSDTAATMVAKPATEIKAEQPKAEVKAEPQAEQPKAEVKTEQPEAEKKPA